MSVKIQNVFELLNEVEALIDAEVEQNLQDDWVNFTFGKYEREFFNPKREKKSISRIKCKHTLVNDTLECYEKMAMQQLEMCRNQLISGAGSLMNIRANYGTCIIPSLFDAETFFMDRELDTLPTNWALKGRQDSIKKALDHGIPDLNKGFGQKVFDMGYWFKDNLAKYPKISKYVHVIHPDLQGPMDLCELLWGSSLFLDLFDEPDLVKSFLDLLTDTYIVFMKKWNELFPVEDKYSYHWGMILKGTVMLRDDSAMNLSPVMFDEFIKPYDQKILNEFGGGGIHFCGKGDHFIENLSKMNGLSIVQLGQPECNDMEIIYKNTIDKGISLIGLTKSAVDEAVTLNRNLKGMVQCWG